MFYVKSSEDATYGAWERKLEAKDGDMVCQCRVFMNESHEVPQFRIDSFTVHGFSFDVGGGPDSVVDFPNIGAPNGFLAGEDVNAAVVKLLARLQAQNVELEYPEGYERLLYQIEEEKQRMERESESRPVRPDSDRFKWRPEKPEPIKPWYDADLCTERDDIPCPHGDDDDDEGFKW